MKTYAVKTQFSFIGKFFIKAESKKEAREWVEHCCGLVIGGGIHTSLSDDLADWEFPKHGYKTIDLFNNHLNSSVIIYQAANQSHSQ